ncbi:putative virulence factor [Pendulispora brunnea]|uniref:Virulence factor n=1 Tax=Pendulispora brunnea TaxID=2905690 RepID=A0ABZ2K006_9BACT
MAQLDQRIADSITQLEEGASTALGASEDMVEAPLLRDLRLRAQKLKKAYARPQCLGFFGPSQAGKSFLVGALLSHELGHLRVVSGERELDFLREINPAKGVESTGVVTRFSTQPGRTLSRGDFECQVLPLDVLLESLATGFLVECTAPPVDAERVARCLRDARVQAGPPAPAIYAGAWESVWHNLQKKYHDRHPYLNELRRQLQAQDAGWTRTITTAPGWILVYSLLVGGPGYARDLEQLLRVLVQGLEVLGHASHVEVGLEHVRATQGATSIIDAGCLNSLGTAREPVRAFVPELGREVAVEPGVLSAVIAELRLVLRPDARATGGLLDGTDLLDFPGGRALKGINGFGPAELNVGRLEHAIEVYKRGKLTFLFEQYALDREITALVLCSPGPTKPEAVQLQSQVENWLRIRQSGAPLSPNEIKSPSLFVALTKFDMSLGALRSDNAKDRWESRVQEACVDFWAKSQSSWVYQWGKEPFSNMFWIRNPYADQMRTLGLGDPDYESVKRGYFESRAVARHIADAEAKWSAVEGEENGLPKSGVSLLASRLRAKMSERVKEKELQAEAESIRAELVALLRSMTPSKDETEQRERLAASAQALVAAVKHEMTRRSSGRAFGDFVRLVIASEEDIEEEVKKILAQVAPMSIKASDKVKKVLAHVLRWWANAAMTRVRESDMGVPAALADRYVREVCTSKKILPLLGTAIYPYFVRTTVDVGLVARILAVKIADSMVDLFVDRPRHTPALPVRLSWSETLGDSENPAQIDWGSVDLDDDGEGGPGGDAEVVFAGSGHFAHWSGQLEGFYLGNAGGRTELAGDEPRVKLLSSVLAGLVGHDGNPSR